MFRRNKPTPEPAPLPNPVTLPPDTGFRYVTAKSLAVLVDGSPVPSVLLAMYDAYLADKQGTVHRLTDALIRAGVSETTVDLPYDAVGMVQFGRVTPTLSRGQFAALLTAIGEGQVYYVANHYADDLPATFMQRVGTDERWTLKAWGGNCPDDPQ